MADINDEQLEPAVIVGSRKSQLALIQTKQVILALQKCHPNKRFDICSMSTTGDKVLDKPLPKIGDKSLFTKELETALEEMSVQFVVHSLKDLPTTLPDGLIVGAVMEREDPRDAVILNESLKGLDLSSLPKGSTIGTSSLRRAAQLQQKFPHLNVDNIRGNLNTRLNKLDKDNKYAAIILAMAGLKRMGWESRISQILEGEDMMYAVGQGALAIECRADDYETLQLLVPLHHQVTALRIIAERSFLLTLGGGCSAPVAVISKYVANSETHMDILELEGGVWSLDGSKVIIKKAKCTIIESQEKTEDEPPRKVAHFERRDFCGITAPLSSIDQYTTAFKLGQELALSLKREGALLIMDEARKQNETN